MERIVTTAEPQFSTAQLPQPNRARARMLIAAALALVVCRLIGAWYSMVGMAVAGAVMATLAIGIVAISSRLRRWMFGLLLPLAVAANAATLAVGLCLACMGSQGLLPGGRLGMKVPWTPLFWCVPLAAAISLSALAKRSSPGLRNRRGAALASNLVTTLVALWYWTIHGAQVYPNSAPPLGSVLLLTVAAISFATLIWETSPPAAGAAPSRRGTLLRIGFVSAVAVPIAATILIAMLPIYRHRQTISELDSLGFDWMPGPVSRWTRKLDEYVAVYDYLADVHAVWKRPAQSITAAGASRVEQVLKRLPALSSLSTNVPPGAARILRPLAGRRWLTQLSLIGPGITDETLTDIAALPRLTHLSISHSSITDGGLAELAKSSSLEAIDLSGAKISGKGLSELASLPRLWALDLTNVPLDDTDLKALERCGAMRMLRLRGTRVTDTGIARLRKALPLLGPVNEAPGPMIPGAFGGFVVPAPAPAGLIATPSIPVASPPETSEGPPFNDGAAHQ